jgi:dTDP-glucose 4,6-dehydratase
MRTLVTGAAGFIGSHLCDALIADGHHVIGVDNLLTGSTDNLVELLDEPRFEFREHDICAPFDFGEVDFVFNFASPASPVDYSEHGIETLKVGSYGVTNALELARRYGARFMQASTSEVYGDPLEHPQRESYWGHVNPIGPRSVYDESKRFAEAMTVAYSRYHGVQTKILRIFNTYGPRLQWNDGRVISNFMKQALAGDDLTVYGDGSQTRSFCYVSDEVEGILRYAASEEHGPMNIGNPDEFTILECANKVLQVTGSKSKLSFEPLPQDDPKQRRPDITLARTRLGWEPKVSLEEGLRLCIPYFSAAPPSAQAA